MSSLVFPSLPGLDVKIEREEEFDTTIHRTASGKEYRTKWADTPLYRYKLKITSRAGVAAPSPNQAYNEASVLLYWIETHRGRFDSFLFDDPYDSVQRRVRFASDGLRFRRLTSTWWECEIELESVR
jgi:hypothetical protein